MNNKKDYKWVEINSLFEIYTQELFRNFNFAILLGSFVI